MKFRTIEPIKVNHDANMALAGFVAVDGKHCEGSGRPIGEMTCEPVYVSGTLTSATTSRSFMFSSIELTGKSARHCDFSKSFMLYRRR